MLPAEPRALQEGLLESGLWREDLKKLLDTAKATAIAAGHVLRDLVGCVHEIRYKGEVNLVTEADIAAERVILDAIRTAYPDQAILSEEGGEGAPPTDNDMLWVVDPLDGTTNFAHGYPVFCVSIALLIKGRPSIGVIYDPMRDELFEAALGLGARMNGRPMHVSKCPELHKALVSTGFVYDRGDALDAPLRRFARMQKASEGLRRDGSAAMNMAHTACGRFDAFFELHLNPWDVAAGFVLVEEAGGCITQSNGQSVSVFDRDVVATNGCIHDEVLSVLQKE